MRSWLQAPRPAPAALCACWRQTRNQELCAHAAALPVAAFTGLHVDVDAVRKDNEAKQGPEVVRKSGLIINAGGACKRFAAARFRAFALSLMFTCSALPHNHVWHNRPFAGITDKAAMELLRRENEKKCASQLLLPTLTRRCQLRHCI